MTAAERIRPWTVGVDSSQRPQLEIASMPFLAATATATTVAAP